MAVVSYSILNLWRLSNRYPSPTKRMSNQGNHCLPFLHLLHLFLTTSKPSNLPLKSPDLLSHSRRPLLPLLLSIPLAGVEQIRTTRYGSSFNEKCSSAASRFFEITLELVATFSTVRSGSMRCLI
jgi:hypothetical protein